jgi:hypothetical protein
MRTGLLCVFWAALLCAGCTTSKRNLPAAAAPLAPPEPYVRLLNSSNRVELQIALRKFDPPRSRRPAIWLVGVSHIGESAYFAALQRELDRQTRVLFEGISNAHDAGSTAESGTNAVPEQAEGSGSSEKLSSLQVSMAETLGLAFQLQAIDYARDNFQNSDLTIQQLREVIAKSGNGASFESLVRMMEGGSWLDAVLQVVLRFLSASPKLQGLGKLALMETINEIKGDPARIQGLPPELQQLLEILISRRDEQVISDLKLQVARMGSGDSIALFYGTGHMPDLEARLRRDLNYHPVKDIWLTAFSVDKAASGISDSEQEFLRSFIERQFHPEK